MTAYELPGDSYEQLLRKDLVTYGSKALLSQPEDDILMCHLEPEEKDMANKYLEQMGMMPAERIGVAFTSLYEGPVKLDSPVNLPYTLFLSADGVVTNYSLMPRDAQQRLRLFKALYFVGVGRELVDAPEREELGSSEKIIVGRLFDKILAESEVEVATPDECRTLVRIFHELTRRYL